MAEDAKRKAPSKDTVQELFAKSGNQCAHPDCDQRLYDADGNYIAQMCHIEAAESGGPRFNGNMTNEDRRHVSNLMLMCYRHHVLTNDENKYTVERLRQMKADHEAKFLNAVEAIWKAIVDGSTSQPVAFAMTLRRLNDTLKWGLSDDQLRECYGDFDDFQQRLQQLPPQTRQLLLVLVSRAGKPNGARKFMSVPHDEICRACNITNQELISHIATLERYQFAFSDHEDMLQPVVSLRPLKHDWPVWQDLKRFCEATGVPLKDIVVEMRLDLLD